MTGLYALIRPLLLRMDAEAAHHLVLRALKCGLGPRYHCADPRLKTRVLGLDFANPLGLAAGFDKDARALLPLLRMGFSFIEAGTVTPRPQAGNPRPRIFRDPGTQSVINRMGFPGRGLEPFIDRMKALPVPHPGIIGANIGINKDSMDPVVDYSEGLAALGRHADYIAVNVSSPNTAGLRDLQAREKLDHLLAALSTCREGQHLRPPLLLKIAPDLAMAEKEVIAELVMRYAIDGLIVSNTTIARPDALPAHLREEKGGLSGPLLRDVSTAAVADMYRLTQGRLPIIGVGGIADAADAYAKILAGAALVQVYTGLVYQGPRLIPRILEGLGALLEKDGFAHIGAAVGAGNSASKRVGLSP